jgi:hypothetical protein
MRTDLSGCHWLLVLPAEQVDGRRIVTEILFAPYKDHWYPSAEVIDFTDPLHDERCINAVGEREYDGSYLLHYVFKRVRKIDGIAYDNDVRVRIREWPEAVVLLLAGGIPES